MILIDGEEHYTRPEAARYLGAPLGTFVKFAYTHAGLFGDARIGSAYLYGRSALDRVRGRFGQFNARHYVIGGRRMLTGAQAARMLGISRQAFSLHVKAGKVANSGYRYSRAGRPLYDAEVVRDLGVRLGRINEG